METPIKKIVIIGGGITGMSAAYYTQKTYQENKIPVEITLIEKSDRLGGKIKTYRHDEFIIEKGPESFLARKTPIITLTKELGLEEELTGTNPKARNNYIFLKGKLHKMPMGLILGIPTKVTPFMKTGLISPFGKIRAAMDLILPKKQGTEDESLGSFIQRRLGREVLDHITEPLLGGIYAGDTHSLSLKATFPHFYELEKSHRSLIKGMLRAKPNVNNVEKLPKAAQNSMFLTYKNGMSTLVERLEEALETTNIITGQGVEKVIQKEQGYEVNLESGEQIQADGLIMALPTYQTAEVLSDIASLTWLEKIKYVSVANIALAFDRSDFTFPLNGSGFVIPNKEGLTITACTWSSSKWLHAAPKGKVLLRCYVGRGGSEEWVHLSDKELISIALQDIKEIMGIKAKPLFHEITRLRESMPQYPVQHVEKLKELRSALETSSPGIFLCGAGYEGVGIPDCIQQGKNAAEQLSNYLY